MGTRQRKVERKQRKRQQRYREQRLVTLRREQRLASDAHPLHTCVINRNWRESGLASIYLARDVGPGCVTMAAFLVDTFAMGLKDAWGRTALKTSEFNKTISRFKENMETAAVEVATVKHLVYGGIALARELGFRLPPRFERWTAILGPLPEGESPDRSLFLDKGKINLVCGMRDLEARLIGTTPERFLNRPDVSFITGLDDFTLVDEQQDAFGDWLNRLEDAMLEQARQWCFAHGQQPHPLLREVVGATLEAAVQAHAPDSDSDSDPETELAGLSEGQRHEAAVQAGSFLEASLHGDRVAIEAAITQLQAFMQDAGSAGDFVDSLNVPEP